MLARDAGVFGWKDRPPKVAEHCMFRLLHVDKKRGEVANASGVGLAKFDATFPDKQGRTTLRHMA